MEVPNEIRNVFPNYISGFASRLIVTFPSDNVFYTGRTPSASSVGNRVYDLLDLLLLKPFNYYGGRWLLNLKREGVFRGRGKTINVKD